MKRAARIFVIPPIFLFLLLLITSAPPAVFAQITDAAEVRVRAWVNDLRAQRGLRELDADPLLEQTAAAYAAELSNRGILSHVDERGRRALQRYQALGGTTVLVGEILGSGPDLPAVIAAWEASSSHRGIVFNPLWTHCGAATAWRSGSNAVWVVLFTSHRAYPLEILRSAEGYLIRGRFTSPRAEQPVLLSGIEAIVPLHWDARSREFSFFVPPEREEIYHRLGYRAQGAQGGGLVVTNTFYPLAVVTAAAATAATATSDRGMEPR